MIIADCPICKEPLGDERTPVTMPCGHLHCLDCATFWFNLRDNQKCHCGRVFGGDDIIRLWFSSESQSTSDPPAEHSATQREELLNEARQLMLNDVNMDEDEQGNGLVNALQNVQDFIHKATEEHADEAGVKNLLRDVRYVLENMYKVLIPRKTVSREPDERLIQELQDVKAVLAFTEHHLHQANNEALTVKRLLDEQLVLRDQQDQELHRRIEDLNLALDIARRNLAAAHNQQEVTQEMAKELREKADKSMRGELKYKKKYHALKQEQERVKRMARTGAVIDDDSLVVLDP